MSIEEIDGWGGRYYRWLGRMESAYVREGVVDFMLGSAYLGYTPHNQYWHQATIFLYDMRFLDLEGSLIEELVRRLGYDRGILPHGILRGVDRDIPTVSSDTIYIYCKKTLSNEIARLIVEGLDKNSDLFKTARSVLYYEREIVGPNPQIPLHPAAEEYYRSKAYIK